VVGFAVQDCVVVLCFEVPELGGRLRAHHTLQARCQYLPMVLWFTFWAWPW
jgi:hypothetical protein